MEKEFNLIVKSLDDFGWRLRRLHLRSVREANS